MTWEGFYDYFHGKLFQYKIGTRFLNSPINLVIQAFTDKNFKALFDLEILIENRA